MTKEEYKKESQHAVKLIKAMNETIGTDYCPDFAQSTADTDYLVNALNLFKSHIETTIDDLIWIDKQYNKEKDYNKFIDKCSRAEIETIKWYDIPQMARDELMDIYRGFTNGMNNVTREDHQELFHKSLEIFKNKYNIKKIEL